MNGDNLGEYLNEKSDNEKYGRSNEYSEGLEKEINRSRGTWSIDSTFARVIVNEIIEGGCRSVLELGAGGSSRLIATALSEGGGGSLTSVEQNPKWCEDDWEFVEKIDNVDSLLVQTDARWTLGYMGVYSYLEGEREILRDRGMYDLLVVDAPQHYYGREGAIPLSIDFMKKGGVILLDDARRRDEKWSIYKWLNTYPRISLDELSEESKGFAVLSVGEGKDKRFSITSFIKGVHHGINRIYAMYY
ncbi:class I SAM-dependent methyltransferase [Salinibacter ruber]|uniref:O-methyltransferase YrrM n=1 Tax=Salinibacter ruber TaxID=146919 RepID=A0A9X2V7G0_9BACT|nr:class I SAM-dependent methyltransferase [Salinibacter ruber]MCS4122737.1 putative O-methyltransferase YrrM [Salinibacter ruber]